MFQNQPFIDLLQKKCSWKILCWNLFLINLQFWGSATLLKKTPTHLLSCETSKFFKNNYFKDICECLLINFYLKRYSNTGAFLQILWIIQDHLFCGGLRTADSETRVQGSLFNKVASLKTWNWKPDDVNTFNSITLAQVFLCKFCEIFSKAFL